MSPRPLMVGYVREELVFDTLETERQLRAYAHEEGFCLDRVYQDAGTTTGSLWVLANEINHGECRDLVVPARAHLDSVPEPRRFLVQRLWSMDPAVRLWSLLAREGRVVLRRYHRPHPAPAMTVLDEWRCPVSQAGLSVSRLHVRDGLTRAGLRDMVIAVDTVVSAFVGEALEATRVRTSREHPVYTRTAEALHKLAGVAFNELLIRLLVTRSNELVVEVVEPREHARDTLPLVLPPTGHFGRF